RQPRPRRPPRPPAFPYTTLFRSMLASPAARAEWWEATTSHFVVYSESSQRDAEKFAVLLERFDNALRILQGMPVPGPEIGVANRDRKSTRLNSSHVKISYAVFCL